MSPHPAPSPTVSRWERGQAIVLLALAVVALLGFAALALDGGNLYTEQRRAQAAADNAVMAAAFSNSRGMTATADLAAVALNHAATNLYNNNGENNWVTFNRPPTQGPYANNPGFLEVIITQSVPTALAHLVYGRSPIPLTVYAVAHGSPTGPIMPGYAIAAFHLGCSPGGNEFTPRGGVGAIIKDGGVYVHSDPNAAGCTESMNMSGSNGRLGTTSSADCPDVSSAATCLINGSYPIHVGGPQTGPQSILCSAPPDWWSNPGTPCTIYGQLETFYTQFPVPSNPFEVSEFIDHCGPNRDDALLGGGGTLNLLPGTYTNMNVGNRNLNLAPGIYCITGVGSANQIMNARTIIGSGVFIYVADPLAQFKFTGGQLNLSAPFDFEHGLNCEADASNPLCIVRGVVYYKADGPDTCSPSEIDIDFSGNSTMVVRGLIWAPESFLSYTGNGDLYQIGQALVGCVKYAGNGALDITYNPNATFSAPPAVRLDQ